MKRKRKYQPKPIKSMQLWEDDSQSSGANIEILPLIDVIFCILTFFILAAVNFSRQQAISLDLPQAKTGAPQLQNILIVTIDDIGQLYVDKNIVSRSDLAWEIKKYNQANPDGLMTLYAAKNSTYREVVEVLDILREVGGNRVALAYSTRRLSACYSACHSRSKSCLTWLTQSSIDPFNRSSYPS